MGGKAVQLLLVGRGIVTIVASGGGGIVKIVASGGGGGGVYYTELHYFTLHFWLFLCMV